MMSGGVVLLMRFLHQDRAIFSKVLDAYQLWLQRACGWISHASKAFRATWI